MIFSIMKHSFECRYTECRYAESRDFLNVRLTVVTLNVIMLNVVKTNVVMLDVVAPKIHIYLFNFRRPMLQNFISVACHFE